MELNKIMKAINDKLAGENLMYSQALTFMDEVIDDINSELNSKYPVFSDFSTEYPMYPNYNFFPDKYIRSVVTTGVAAKFYTVDEEGAQVAPQLQYTYRDNLARMKRDYSIHVPLAYQDSCENGMLHDTSCQAYRDWVGDMCGM